MQEQITYYHDPHNLSAYCNRVEIALLEAGASYTTHAIEIYGDKPAWFSQINPRTGKIPVITYGGPNVKPDEPSPLSFKLTESLVILEFLADIFPGSKLLPPVSNPTARASVRLFVDTVTRLDAPLVELASRGNSEMVETIIDGLEKVQALLSDPETADGGEFAVGKEFTNADCAFVPILATFEVIAKTGRARLELKPGTGEKLGAALASDRFKRLRRYKKAVWERESVRKVLDLQRMENIIKGMRARA